MEQTSYNQTSSSLEANPSGGARSETRFILIASDNAFRSLEVAAMVDVFNQANRLANKAAYTVRIISTNQEQVNPKGLNSTARVALEEISDPIDTFIVTGSDHIDRSSMPGEYRRWLRLLNSTSRRTVAIGGGTLTLAAAGLLDGRKAVTHWALHQRLKQLFPRVLLEPNGLYTNDHNLYTCAGATASLDLALRLVEDDLNSDIAAKIASTMLLHFRRTGDSRQISVTLQAQASSSDPMPFLLGWLPDNLMKDLSVRALAKRVAMSPRNFARCFQRQVGVTPAKFIESLRFEAAQRELENGRQTVAKAAELSGFSNTESLRRIFVRRLGLTPAVFRRRLN